MRKILLALSCLLAAGAAGADPLPPDAAALVDGETVPMAEVQALLLRRHGAAIVRELVLRRLIEREAGRAGIAVEDAELARRTAEAVEELKRQVGTEATLQGLLQVQGVSEAEFRDQLGLRILLEKLTVRETLCGTWVRVAAIFSSTEERALALAARLKAGESFGDLAKAESTDPRSAAQGGDLGIHFPGELPRDLDGPAFALPVDGTSGVIRTNLGFVLLRVTARQEARPRPYAEIRAEVEARIAKDPPAQDLLERTMRRLRRAAAVRAQPGLAPFPDAAP